MSIRTLSTLLILNAAALAQIPYIPAKTVEQTQSPVFQDGSESRPLANFKLDMSYESESSAKLQVHDDLAVDLPKGTHHLSLTYESVAGFPAEVSATLDDKPIHSRKVITGDVSGSTFQSDDKKLRLDQDYTVAASFTSKGRGTIFSKCRPTGKWSPDAKALFIRNGRLVYDIGWLGDLVAGPRVNDGKIHHVVVRITDGQTEMYIDGKLAGMKSKFTAKDHSDFVFKIGKAAPNFGLDFKDGTIHNVRYWPRSLSGDDLKAAVNGQAEQATSPELNWSQVAAVETFDGVGHPGIATRLKLAAGDAFKLKHAWVQPLNVTDHAGLIAGWNKDTLNEGAKIYNTLCVTCHGTPTKEGSLPTALKFHEAPFKNGSDPFRMFQTLTKGYGLMVPQPQYTAAQKYAVIQYIRETFVKKHNPSQYFDASETYLAALPKKLRNVSEAAPVVLADQKQYQKMDFGPALIWTYQVGKSGDTPNIAQKGIAVRLDSGPGGVSKGRGWMIYEEDTMRIAAAYTGSFVNWKGIAFDGSHGTHTSIAGTPTFVTPDAPAWRHPSNKTWDDQRVVGRDGRRYGPLPRDWMQYLGKYVHGDKVTIRYRVGDAEILELPGFIDYGNASVFTRTLNIRKSSHDLVTRLAPDAKDLRFSLHAADGISVDRVDGYIQLTIPAKSTPTNLTISFSKADQATIDSLTPSPQDLTPLTQGGPSRFGKTIIKTAGERGNDEDAFAVDTITIPAMDKNPWESWMRLGGFDFFASNPDRAAVCTWLGDVWLVDGIAGDLTELKWRRICSGLFQPLGLKIVKGQIYVTCRDQIARLHDLNGDEEIDYIESFNGDHQVTEHFHEFAMGLQVDDAGNFYYAKSARHALKAVVPHHGTLLRVSPDGSKTDIVANGFRAANGVCLNPDGTWIVTDQEGHWNPKNRINYVREGGFYGNMFGYHDVTDSSDSAMEQPLAWITNAFDRSPAELLWVPDDAKWGALKGVLLNLSYGYGMVYTVPHEIVEGQAQGGMCALPIDRFPTGIHRGRFHPSNKQLYVAGMFAWASSQRTDTGGFYRIRYTGKPMHLPTKLEARKAKLTVTFTDPVPANSEFQVKTWDLQRTARYGSKHYNEKSIEVTKVEVNGSQATLTIPDLKPTWGMEVRAKLGGKTERVIHNSIHHLK